ncbi:MAG: tetratricopeptide repeat protein [Saprospiraceae bacterium]|nr:tetratricopeptide repeat protein [Saprospiraceae bacterium]
MPTDRMQNLLSLLETSPDDSFLLFAIAKEHETAGDLDKALAQYQLLGDKDPDYVGLYYHLGKLLERLEHTEEAKNAYEKGMKVAKKAGDRHAWNELSAANMDMEF